MQASARDIGDDSGILPVELKKLPALAIGDVGVGLSAMVFEHGGLRIEGRKEVLRRTCLHHPGANHFA
jgi:hypothetical protein